MLNLSDFQFHLPEHLIARFPPEKRTDSRLLCAAQGEIAHRQFHQIIDYIQPGDLMIFNDTKVIRARLHGKKKTGGKVEVLIERVLDDHHALGQIRSSKSIQPGDPLYFGDIILTVEKKEGSFYTLTHQETTSFFTLIEQLGEVPLPPYFKRAPETLDCERYQTVYAAHQGSVAAPTAGFHFDHALLQQLRDKGVQMGMVTLHIGAGTFAPVRAQDIREHQMHAEYCELSEALCDQIKKTKAAGKRVIAVGTTSLRTLETAAQSGEIGPYRGETRLFVYPGYTFHCVDALITNFHLPGSTLLMLVSAFAGYEKIMHIYQEAISCSYRFYSYGDAMYLERAI
jgi:S-adenosylmethionine:tRNA ribosyltransferase-isomerase